MVQVVTGDLQRQVADALSVHAVALPLIGRELREHSQVGLAQQAKQRQRLVGPARWVIAQLVPQLLIVVRLRTGSRPVWASTWGLTCPADGTPRTTFYRTSASGTLAGIRVS